MDSYMAPYMNSTARKEKSSTVHVPSSEIIDVLVNPMYYNISNQDNEWNL